MLRTVPFAAHDQIVEWLPHLKVIYKTPYSAGSWVWSATDAADGLWEE